MEARRWQTISRASLLNPQSLVLTYIFTKKVYIVWEFVITPIVNYISGTLPGVNVERVTVWLYEKQINKKLFKVFIIFKNTSLNLKIAGVTYLKTLL